MKKQDDTAVHSRYTSPYQLEPLTFQTPSQRTITTYLVNDATVLGGTKARLFHRIIHLYPDCKEFVYVGSHVGLGGLAMTVIAKLYSKKATLFVPLNIRQWKGPLPDILQTILSLGGTIYFYDSDNKEPYTIRKYTKRVADAYVAKSKSRCMIELGLSDTDNQETHLQTTVNLMKDLLAEVPVPKRVWLTVGSGFLLSILHEVWKDTRFMCVQIGKTVWQDQLRKGDKLFIAPEQYYEMAKKNPPYDTIPWYEAKMWRFIEKYGQTGDYIWNVGAVHPSTSVSSSKHSMDGRMKTYS